MLRGLRHFRWTFPVALICSWTLLPIAFWGLAIGVVLGGLAGLVNDLETIRQLHSYGIDAGVGWVSLLGTTLAGGVVGFLLIYGGIWSHAPIALAENLIVGGLLGVVVVWLWGIGEPLEMRLRGYRRMSKMEAEIVDPGYAEVAALMSIANPPVIMIQDTSLAAIPNAYTYLRHIVLTKSLVEVLVKHPEQGSAVLTHELEHYRRGHVIARRVIWGASLPNIIALNLSFFLKDRSMKAGRTALSPLFAGISYFIFWPSVCLEKYVVGSIMGHEGREHEYQCDAAAVRCGFGQGIFDFLSAQQEYDRPTSGWDEVIKRTHPPTELRLEAILDLIGTPPAKRGAVPALPGRQRSRQPERIEPPSPPPRVPAVVQAPRQRTTRGAPAVVAESQQPATRSHRAPVAPPEPPPIPEVVKAPRKRPAPPHGADPPSDVLAGPVSERPAWGSHATTRSGKRPPPAP